MRRFCSPAFSNSSGTVPATLTYPTFTLTLETGACVLTTDFTPNPDNPYDDWLATKGFVCKTPQLSFDQVRIPQACLLDAIQSLSPSLTVSRVRAYACTPVVASIDVDMAPVQS